MNVQEIVAGMKILEKWKSVQEGGYKTFLIFQNEREFYNKIPEEIYSIYDCHGIFVGDLLESDYLEFHGKGIIINTDEYVMQDFSAGYPIDIANYFVSKEYKEAIPQIKKKRCVITILDEPKWKRQK